MNLPNKLTIMRVCFVPLVLVCIVIDFGIGYWSWFIAAALFSIASITDILDGKIARKNNLITDFGKFMDPLADKFLVIGSLVALCLRFENDIFGKLFLLTTVIVILRELAVTSMRLVVVNTDGTVVAASVYGKVKTTTQDIGILILLLEPLVCEIFGIDLLRIPSYVTIFLITVTTVISGVNYLKTYWKYIKTK